MITQVGRSLLQSMTRHKVIPVIESRVQFSQILEHAQGRALLLRHCNLFDLTSQLSSAYRCGYSVYVNVDHIDGIHPDAAGLHYLAEHLHVAGIVSNHPKILSLGKQFGLETIQRIFTVDSTGLETALESVDREYIDVLDIAPALVIPYLIPELTSSLPLPFIGSGMISTSQQIQRVLRSGACGVASSRPELWL